MVLDLIWVTGEALSIVGLLYGAYLALMEVELFRKLFGNLQGAPGAWLGNERRVAGKRASYIVDGPGDYSHPL